MCSAVNVEVRDCCDLTEGVVPGLGPDVVHVWMRRLQVAPALEADLYALLSPDEREQAARYRVERARRDFILTRGTLRSLIAGYLGKAPQGLVLKRTHYGKPFLDGPFDLRFNVSHTEGLALLAFVGKREIGIDVEKIRPQPDAAKLAERFFSTRERRDLAHLSGSDLQKAFFRCWSRKEAYIKARGDGLSLPLNQFDVSVAADASRVLLATRPDSSEAGRWVVRDVTTSPEYAAAVAVAETVNP